MNNLRNYKTQTFARCYYVFFVNGILAISIGSLLPYIKESYQLSYQVSGFLVSAHAIGNLFSSFLGGILPIKFGRKKTFVSLGFLGIIAFLLMTWTTNQMILILTFFLTGINRGTVSNFSNAVINDISTGKAWALNLLHAIFSMGAFIAPFIVLFLTRHTHQNWIYVAWTEAVLITISLIVVLFMKIPNNYPAGNNKPKTDWTFIKNKYFLISAGILFFYLCVEQSINGWLVTYLHDSGILDNNFAQIMTSVLWLVILIGRLLTALLSTKIKKSYLLLGTSIGYVVFSLILLFVHHSIITSIGIIGVGLFMSGIYATTLSSIGNILKEYPASLSILLAIGGLGSILMPSIVGIVANRIGIKWGMAVIIIAISLNVFFVIINAHVRNKDSAKDTL